MTPESQTKSGGTRFAEKCASNGYENLSHLGEQSTSFLSEQYIDLIRKQAKTGSGESSLTAEEFYKTFNESFSAISHDQTQITRGDIELYKHNPLRLPSSPRTWASPAESRREAMLEELSENFDDLRGLSRASWGLQSGVRKEDVKLFYDIYTTRAQGGCCDSISNKERKLYEKTASSELGAGFIGFTTGSILGARAFPKVPAMVVGAAAFSLAGAAIGSSIDKYAGSSHYDQDKERLNRLMSNLGNANR